MLLLSNALLAAVLSQSPDPFARCLADLRASPAARRVSVATWEQHVTGVTADSAVLGARAAQPEFRLHLWDYVAVMADSERVNDGMQQLATHRAVFDAIATRFQVEPAVVAAIWGIESNYGRGRGGFPVIRSLATLACHGSRQRYFRGELLAALRILQAGHIAPDRFRGSWAGAFGHTQFMPGTFEWLAVDFDGDGRSDVMDNVADALGSTANYLKRRGWRPGLPWGFEVQLPTTLDQIAPGRKRVRPIAEWERLGVRLADGRSLRTVFDGQVAAGLHAPTGRDGPRFLVTHNFEVIYRYNASEHYALAIAHLADRLRGGAAFATPWPTTDPGLSRAERRDLQRLLALRGHPVGAPSGILTPATIAAVRAEQARLREPVDGRPGQRLLRLLRGETSP